MKNFGFDSVAEAYGPLAGNQYDVVASVWNGQDVRTFDLDHKIVNALIQKKILRADPDSCRLSLCKPANAVRANQGVFA